MSARDWQKVGPTGDSHARDLPRLSVVLPCYNEAANVAPLYQRLVKACPDTPLEILFVDDGSRDGTREAVERLRRLDPRVRLLRFVRNAGHQKALRAGLRASRGDFVLTMDADLQHPAESIPAMLEAARQGFDVVQMVRQGSQKGFLKDLASRAFYKVFNSLSDVPLVEQGSDFRLVSRHACDVINALPERNLVVRAILPYLGFRTASLAFPLGDRLHGEAGFTFRKSMDLGAQALFEFSSFPLKAAMRLGIVISALAFAYGLYNVAAKFLSDGNVPGYTDLIASTLFLGGLILVYLGILGRYILVIVDHLKNRPEYLAVEDTEMLRPAPSPEAPRKALADPAYRDRRPDGTGLRSGDSGFPASR